MADLLQMISMKPDLEFSSTLEAGIASLSVAPSLIELELIDFKFDTPELIDFLPLSEFVEYYNSENPQKNEVTIAGTEDIGEITFVDLPNEFEGKEIDWESEEYLIAYQTYSSDFTDSDIKIEPILSEESFRYTVYPIRYQTIWKNYKDQQKINWVIEEIDLSKDLDHWEKNLSKNDRVFIMHILAFFSAFDGIVDENIKKNLIDMVKIKEAECAYGKQFDMENVHGEMYSLMLDTFVKDPVLKDKLINSIRTMSCVQKKSEWYKKWINSDKSFAHKLVASAIVEGIFFSGSFASIFWLKTRPGSIMPGLRKSNKFIARDENKHIELACIIYALLENKLKQAVIYTMIDEAVQLEDQFIISSLPCKLLGMNSDLMSEYIKYVADRLLVQLGYPKKYHATNPLEYMKKIDTFTKSNFFEERNDAYSDGKIDNPRVFELVDQF
jgi:ribonucleoside-diphosphate reductase beta chain